jgi:hypothetical protein
LFQSIVASEVEGRNASAVWIDVENEASTYALNHFSDEAMEKVLIGRSFTPFQHYHLIEQLEQFIRPNTELLVLPNVTSLYRKGQIKEAEGRQLFKQAWKKINQLQDKKSLKVLISARGFSEIIEEDVENTIDIEETQEGLKTCGEYQQMSYSKSGRNQSTLRYWSQKNKTESQLEV